MCEHVKQTRHRLYTYIASGEKCAEKKPELSSLVPPQWHCHWFPPSFLWSTFFCSLHLSVCIFPVLHNWSLGFVRIYDCYIIWKNWIGFILQLKSIKRMLDSAMMQQKQKRKGESCTLMFIFVTRKRLATGACLANLISVAARFYHFTPISLSLVEINWHP